MARREYQNPSIQVYEAKAGPEYYVRVREKTIKIIDGRPQTVKVEHRRRLCAVSEGIRKAERVKSEVLRKINRQLYAVQTQIPFSQFLEIYRAQHLRLLADTTQRTYDQWLRLYIEPAFGARNLCDIGPLDIQAFLLSLGLAANTRASVRGVLASVYKQAIRWGYWRDRSPVDGVRLGPRQPARARTTWTLEQMRRILAAVRDDVGLICETLMWTGMRISECLALTPAALRLDSGEVLILSRHSRGSTQGTKSTRGVRALPLGYLAARYAVRMRGLAADSWIFPDVLHPDRPYRDCELLSNYLTPILRKLGLKQPGTGWHTFRRSLASWMNAAGATAFDVRDQLGHADVATTGLYVQTGPRRASLINEMQSAFLGIIGENFGKKGLTQ